MDDDITGNGNDYRKLRLLLSTLIWRSISEACTEKIPSYEKKQSGQQLSRKLDLPVLG